VVGFGNDGNYFGDSTGLAGTITAPSVVPEPSSLLLVAAGILSVLGAARRRQLSR
jgi:hypothetical protein